MKKITYVIESRGMQVDVRKVGPDGKPIKTMNELGNWNGGFEEYHVIFQKCVEKKHGRNGEYEVLSKFTVDDTTPPEVAKRMEEKVKEGMIEREIDYLARVNKDQADAIKRADALEEDNKRQKDIIAELEAKVAAMKNEQASPAQGEDAPAAESEAEHIAKRKPKPKG
jgi:hypothetical protein